MIANGLDTVDAPLLMQRCENLIQEHAIEDVVIGEPKELSGEPSEIENQIQAFIVRFKTRHPQVNIHRLDERFTSKIALDAMIASGAKKKQRREKGNVDKISATLLLQEFLNSKA